MRKTITLIKENPATTALITFLVIVLSAVLVVLLLVSPYALIMPGIFVVAIALVWLGNIADQESKNRRAKK